MLMVKKGLLLALAISFVQGAVAEEETAAAKTYPIWSGSAELGSVWTSGNTDTSSVNAKLEVMREAKHWESKVRFDALTSEEDNKTTKEKYKGLTQLNYKLTDRSYIAGVAWQERDRFSGFYYQSAASLGLGYRIISRDNMGLEIEVGPGYSRERERESHQLNSEAIGRGALKYQWTIRDGVSFIEDFSVEAGESNAIYISETGLKSQINGSLATKLTYKVKYVDKVPTESENRDSEFGVTLVYSF